MIQNLKNESAFYFGEVKVNRKQEEPSTITFLRIFSKKEKENAFQIQSEHLMMHGRGIYFDS
jgi:hypothetical protein